MSCPDVLRPPRLSRQPLTHTFTELAQAVRTNGLQGRRRTFYAIVFAALVLGLGGVATGMILLDNSCLKGSTCTSSPSAA